MATGDSNIHLYNLNINEESESFTQTVSVVDGVGLVSRKPLTATGAVSYGEATETVTFSGKSFTITDTAYSGDISVQYSAKKFFILKSFNLFLSGLTQINTFIARIVVKLTGTADSYSVKNALASIRARFVSTALASVAKNIIQSVSINFSLVRQISSKKNAIANISIIGNLVNALSSKRNFSSAIVVKCGGSADATVSQYVLISDYVALTIEEMKTSTLNELIYTIA